MAPLALDPIATPPIACVYQSIVFPVEIAFSWDVPLGQIVDGEAVTLDDVAELWWHYNNSFWPDWAVEKDKFLNEIKENLESGVYDIEL